MQVAGIRRIGDRAERIEVGELRPLADDWMLLTVMAAGMGNRHESARTCGWDGLPGRRWRWGGGSRHGDGENSEDVIDWRLVHQTGSYSAKDATRIIG
jgi:hypothetical protein